MARAGYSDGVAGLLLQILRRDCISGALERPLGAAGAPLDALLYEARGSIPGGGAERVDGLSRAGGGASLRVVLAAVGRCSRRAAGGGPRGRLVRNCRSLRAAGPLDRIGGPAAFFGRAWAVAHLLLCAGYVCHRRRPRFRGPNGCQGTRLGGVGWTRRRAPVAEDSTARRSLVERRPAVSRRFWRGGGIVGAYRP